MSSELQEFNPYDSRVSRQYEVFVILCIGIAVWAELGYLLNKTLFKAYFGGVNPLLAVLLVSLFGCFGLIFLVSRNHFVIPTIITFRAWSFAFILAAFFATAAILVDIKVRFPADMNLPFPKSLFFYPVIGFCVEVVFHILPLSLLFLIFKMLFRRIESVTAFWTIIIVVCLLEPVFQTVSGYSMKPPVWVFPWTFAHVFLINFAQLLIFKRYGFIWMYLFRLEYYLFWHIIWGNLRLYTLF